MEPEPTKPDEEPSNDQMELFKKFFYETAGQDMEVDSFELHNVINKGLANGNDIKTTFVFAKTDLNFFEVNCVNAVKWDIIFHDL